MSRNIKSIHDSDLEKMLRRLKVYDEIVAGEKTCYFCNKIITLDNFYAVFYHDGAMRFACDDVACIVKFTEFLEQLNKNNQ